MESLIRDARILVVVKAYPNPSRAHRETVCTAGLLNGKEWIRIYPVPFRMLKDEAQYPKFGWIRLDIERRTKDFRPESYHLLRGEQEAIRLDGSLAADTAGWRERKRLLLREVYDSMDSLIQRAKSSERISLGIVKPREVFGVVAEETKREWDPETIAALQEPDLFDPKDNLWQLVKKIPYKFYYHFRTSDGKDRQIMVEDWEIGALYWNCLRREKGDEARAVEKVKQKLWYLVQKCDLYFVMGTTQAHHLTAPNPFVIIGLFYPPIDSQIEFPGFLED